MPELLFVVWSVNFKVLYRHVMLCASSSAGANEQGVTQSVLGFGDLKGKRSVRQSEICSPEQVSQKLMDATLRTQQFGFLAPRLFPPRTLFTAKPTPQNESNFSFSGAECMNRHVSSSRILLVVFAMVSLLVVTTGISQGQAISGNLTGTVTDASGAAVNGATVEAVNLGTGQKITATTRGSGEYNFAELPVGNYRLTVTAANFRTTTVGSVPVDLNKT